MLGADGVADVGAVDDDAEVAVVGPLEVEVEGSAEAVEFLRLMDVEALPLGLVGDGAVGGAGVEVHPAEGFGDTFCEARFAAAGRAVDGDDHLRTGLLDRTRCPC